MLKRAITYTNLDGERVTKDFYFNLSMTEIVDLEVANEGESYGEKLQKVAAGAQPKEIIETFRELILAAYGERDGDVFMKSDHTKARFRQHPAYDVLFFELLSNPETAAEFVTAVLPADLAARAAKATETRELPQPEPKDQLKHMSREDLEAALASLNQEKPKFQDPRRGE